VKKPAAPAAAQAARVTPPASPKPGEGPCAPALVFVVDDDPSVRRSLANLLESGDYAVETFASAAEFLRRAEHLGASCLVLDVRLPGLDGLGLQRHLAERGRSEQIVFITGHGDIPMGVQAMKCGAVDFLPKPFGDDQLLEAVARALARSAETLRARGEREAIRARLATLTPREFEVFRLVIGGLLNKQIGAELGVALRTIKTHRSRVFRKLGVVSVAELTRLAQKAGVEPAPSLQPGPGSP
jgi:FixJ family two-component response regulator